MPTDQHLERRKDTGYIRGFDGLRAISIVLVIAAHSGLYYLFPDRPYFRFNLFAVVSGATGVNIFFVLSGYLITGSLLREKAGDTGIDLRHFYLRRALRLFPALLLFFVLLAVRHATQGLTLPLRNVWMALLYVSNFSPQIDLQGAGVLTSHMWSLAVEEQFYLLWPVLLLLLPLRRVWWLSIAVIVLCALVAIPLQQLPVRVDGVYVPLAAVNMPHRWTIPAVAPIFIGSITAILLHLRRDACLLLLRTRVAPVLAVVLFLAPVYVNSIFLQMNIVAIPRSVGVAILLAWLHVHQGSWLASALEWRPLAYIGRVSYGLYLYHALFIGDQWNYLMFPSYTLSLAALLVFTALSFHFYERPILRLKHRWARPQRRTGH